MPGYTDERDPVLAQNVAGEFARPVSGVGRNPFKILILKGNIFFHSASPPTRAGLG